MDQTIEPTTVTLPPDFPDRAAFEAEWCADLRSGDVEPAQGQLRRGARRCCLGVACDIAIRHGIGQWDGDTFLSPTGQADGGFLPIWLADHLGRTSSGMPHAEGGSLTSLNDRPTPWTIIAGVIDGSIAYADAEQAAAQP